ncbi:MAG: ATP-dependent DNA helicase RecG, partial [Prevotellaceae bacterium]|jgi:ATP-dependent DNA helicase RecG|nr:ATP-dependent DNA helicase RecG [Prevotellaceae bacterium]
MSADDKQSGMQRFVRGEAHIMVATSVIEVGVNVPNATVMIIESAERFGLSQLHQLRGRVGRGAQQSFCILMTGYKLTAEARQRMELMTATNNGFEIANADLNLRGPGDLEGTMQSGQAFDLRIADRSQDAQLLEYVRQIADDILADDPALADPQNAILLTRLAQLKNNAKNYSEIS